MVQSFKLMNRRHPYYLHSKHKGSRPNRHNFGTDLPKGQRDESMLRHFLIAELFRAWVGEFGTLPVINNKGYNSTQFVIFAHEIFGILGIGKTEDHLEKFQSFRANSLKNHHFQYKPASCRGV
jgi:hypothetical protein